MPNAFTTRPELQGTHGMVSTTHWLATAAGMAMLERGATAFDAAVCAGFVLQVVEPDLNGLGGEVPILLRQGFDGPVRVVRGQGPAPQGATPEQFAALGLDSIPRTGYLPACVPGAFGAWMTLLRDHGTVTLAEALEHAIGYAAGGFPVLARVANVLAKVEDLFRTHWPDSAAHWLAQGVPEAGSRLRNLPLAQAYRRLVAAGEAGGRTREVQIEAATAAFYDGFVAEAIERHLRATPTMDSSGEAHFGLLRAADLHGWRAAIEDPASLDYHGFRVYKTQPWGQGPVFLQQLALLKGYELRALGHLSADYVHLVVEAAKLAFADREAWYADPAFADIPLATLLSEPYAAERRRLIADRASLELRPGAPDGRVPSIPHHFARPEAVQLDDAGIVPVLADGSTRDDTCHIAVIDRFGNMVAATPSGGMLQSSPTIPALGFCLGARAQMFNLTRDHPNRLQPGKVPRTTLSPTIAISEDLALAFGTRGGDKQDQWTLNFFLGVAAFGLNLQEAIDAPNFHTTHCPDSFHPHAAFPGRVHIEDRFPEAVTRALTARGHLLQREAPWSLGHVCAVGRDARRGILLGAATARGMNAYAAGR